MGKIFNLNRYFAHRIFPIFFISHPHFVDLIHGNPIFSFQTTTIWKFVILVGKRLSTEARKYFFDTIFLSEIQKKSEVLIIKKIIIIARLVFEISQFFKNFSFFFGHRARSRGMAKKKFQTKRAMIIIFLIIKTSDFF